MRQMRYYIVAENGDWMEAEENTPGAQEYDEFEHLESLIERVNSWDRENVRELKNIIDQIAEVERDAGVSRFDISSLPTEEIPVGLETYPVWACDKAGRCLVGETADEVEDMDQILEWYADKPTPHSITAHGYESVEKTAKRNGNSSAVTLPASWLAHRVLCIRMD